MYEGWGLKALPMDGHLVHLHDASMGPQMPSSGRLSLQAAQLASFAAPRPSRKPLQLRGQAPHRMKLLLGLVGRAVT